jgi:hypothetical protein
MSRKWAIVPPEELDADEERIVYAAANASAPQLSTAAQQTVHTSRSSSLSTSTTASDHGTRHSGFHGRHEQRTPGPWWRAGLPADAC